MGALSVTDPRWTAADGTDRGWPRPLGNDADMFRGLALMAAAIDAATDMSERGDIERDDIEDTARSIVGRIATMADREPRAFHSWWHGDTPRGDEARHAAAPDVHERVRARRRKVRTNRGETVDMVSVHGRAYVIGATDAAPNRAASMSAPRVSAFLADVPRAAVGRDAVDLFRATEVIYGRAVPALIGADVIAWHDAPNTDAVRGDDDTRARRAGRRWPTRYRIATPRARATDDIRAGECLAGADLVDIEREHVPADIERDERGRVTYVSGSPRVRVTTVPRSVAWAGHRLIVRGDTYRDKRAARRRGVDEALLIREHDDIGHVLASVAAAVDAGPWRATWEWRGHRGAVTVSPRGHYSVTGLPAGPRQVKARTAAALERSVARAIA